MHPVFFSVLSFGNALFEIVFSCHICTVFKRFSTGLGNYFAYFWACIVHDNINIFHA